MACMRGGVSRPIASLGGLPTIKSHGLGSIAEGLISATTLFGIWHAPIHNLRHCVNCAAAWPKCACPILRSAEMVAIALFCLHSVPVLGVTNLATPNSSLALLSGSAV